MARGKAHDEATRAAVIASLLSGQGVNETADAYNLPPQVVSDWKKAIPEEKFGQLRTEKAESFDRLISDYLAANLRALKAQAIVAAEPEYIRKQTAERLAVLHGVMADKAVRLFEAAGSAEGEPAAEEAEE